MTLFFPPTDFELSELVEELAHKYTCTERATEEILQYARVLCARGFTEEQLAMAVGRYARIRGETDRDWCY